MRAAGSWGNEVAENDRYDRLVCIFFFSYVLRTRPIDLYALSSSRAVFEILVNDLSFLLVSVVCIT